MAVYDFDTKISVHYSRSVVVTKLIVSGTQREWLRDCFTQENLIVATINKLRRELLICLNIKQQKPVGMIPIRVAVLANFIFGSSIFTPASFAALNNKPLQQSANVPSPPAETTLKIILNLV